MKTQNYFRLTASILSLLVITSIVGCQKEDTGHDPFRSRISIKCPQFPNTDFNADSIRLTLAAQGQSVTFNISTSPDVSWQTYIPEINQAYASFTLYKGSSSSSNTLTVGANTQSVERKFTIPLEAASSETTFKKRYYFIITQPKQ